MNSIRKLFPIAVAIVAIAAGLTAQPAMAGTSSSPTAAVVTCTTTQPVDPNNPQPPRLCDTARVKDSTHDADRGSVPAWRVSADGHAVAFAVKAATIYDNVHGITFVIANTDGLAQRHTLNPGQEVALTLRPGDTLQMIRGYGWRSLTVVALQSRTDNHCAVWREHENNTGRRDAYRIGIRCSSLAPQTKARAVMDIAADFDRHSEWFTTLNTNHYTEWFTPNPVQTPDGRAEFASSR